MADKAPTPAAEGMAARRAAVVSCWLCGTRLHHSQMVPDGGSACDDIRWYCQDVRTCTERWATARRQKPAAGAAPAGSANPVPSAHTAKPAAAGSAARPPSARAERGDGQ
jgi:hypothetical protein